MVNCYNLASFVACEYPGDQREANHNMLSFPGKWFGRVMKERLQLFYLDVK